MSCTAMAVRPVGFPARPASYAQGHAFKKQTWEAVANFEAFDRDSDPYGEHDFGLLEVDGRKLYFKIDYYGLDLASASDDPADRRRTNRVLTIMLAEEY